MAAAAAAQPADEAGRFEAYLQRLELRSVAAADLRRRLEDAPAEERPAVATKLGDLYVELIEQASTPEERERLEDLGRRLVRQIPEEGSGDLRLALVRARYQWAKSTAERSRLGSVDPEQVEEADRTLRGLLPELGSVADTAGDLIDRLDRRRLSVGLEPEETELLQDALRVRSTAHYLLGWAKYYIAMIAGAERFASDALKDLGMLLGSEPGRPASVERLDTRLLRFEHVADSAIAAAFCESILGNGETALRWITKIEEAPGLPPNIQARLFACRMLVLGEAERWRDLGYYSDLRRRARRADGHLGLEPLEAQLLARLSWEALTDTRLPPRDRSVLEEVAYAALQDLVRAGQVDALRSLVDRFGTASLDAEGFIFAFVRGQNAFERATSAYEDAGFADGEITTDDAVRNLYFDARDALDAALSAGDADRYPDERAQAMQLAAMATFLGGSLADAADRFEAAHAEAADAEQSERSLWHAIVALDQAVQSGQQNLQPRRERLATLYLQSFPGTERAARLLVARAGAAGAGDPRAIQILLDVKPDSPLYESARRRAERLLFARVRTLRGDARAAAALRYLTVADELLALERRRAATGSVEAAEESAGRALALARAMLQTILASPLPDIARAEALLAAVDDLALRVGSPPDAIAAELAYRRVQIALAKGMVDDARRLADQLTEEDEPFYALARRALYTHAARGFAEAPRDAALAALVVEFGRPVIAELGTSPQNLASPQVFTVHGTVGSAAWVLWRAREAQAEAARATGAPDIPREEEARAMLDLLLAIDGRLLEADLADAAGLQRVAYASEAAGRTTDALDAWRRVLAGVEAESPRYLRARYEAARLLSQEDPGRALAALRQHLVLQPDAPPPWDERIRALFDALDNGRPLPPSLIDAGNEPPPAPLEESAPAPPAGGGP
ncbi:MAG: hypothetical protein AAFX79_07335 [Planctomycetota bacterium]